MFNHKYVVPVSRAGMTVVLSLVAMMFYGILTI